jgi:Uma2 family endonuclease
VPEPTIFRAGLPRKRKLTHPPLLVTEIQAPEDILLRALPKAEEFMAFGIEQVWVIDPTARVGYPWHSKRFGTSPLRQA